MEDGMSESPLESGDASRDNNAQTLQQSMRALQYRGDPVCRGSRAFSRCDNAHTKRSRIPLRSVTQASVQYFGVHVPVSGVAAACRGFKTTAVEPPDLTAVVFDQSVALQDSGSGRDADTAHAKHIGKKFVGDMKAGALQAPTGALRTNSRPHGCPMQFKSVRRVCTTRHRFNVGQRT